MIERFIHDLALKAKSATGASGEVAILVVASAVFGIVAVVFLSLAGYAWLATIYSPAVAWLIVGGVHLLIAAAVTVRCVVVRRQNRALALAQIELAASQHQQSAWKFDPSYLAIGIQVARAVGIKNLIPLVVGGIIAAGVGAAGKDKPTAR